MVFDCRIAPEYFLDHMSIREAVTLLERYNENYRERWEQARFTGIVAALTGKIKENAFERLTSFSWEKKAKAKEKPSPAKLAEMQKDFTAAYQRFTEGKTETLNIHGKI